METIIEYINYNYSWLFSGIGTTLLVVIFTFFKKNQSHSTKQNQRSGNNSTNIQVEGISYSDAKEIANDVFKTNSIELKQEFAVIAQERTEEVTEKVISQLNDKHPESISEFKQSAI